MTMMLMSQRLAADSWGADRAVVKDVFDPLDKWLVENAPGITERYPRPWKPQHWSSRMVRHILLAVSRDKSSGSMAC
jgi:hypothetical protein